MNHSRESINIEMEYGNKRISCRLMTFIYFKARSDHLKHIYEPKATDDVAFIIPSTTIN